MPERRRPVRKIAAVAGVAATLVALAIVVHPFARLGHGDRRSTISTGGSPSISPSDSTEIVGASGLVVAYSRDDVRFCGGAMTLALTPVIRHAYDQLRAPLGDGPGAVQRFAALLASSSANMTRSRDQNGRAAALIRESAATARRSARLVRTGHWAIRAASP